MEEEQQDQDQDPQDRDRPPPPATGMGMGMGDEMEADDGDWEDEAAEDAGDDDDDDDDDLLTCSRDGTCPHCGEPAHRSTAFVTVCTQNHVYQTRGQSALCAGYNKRVLQHDRRRGILDQKEYDMWMAQAPR